MAKTVNSTPTVLTGEVVAPPSPNLLTDKRSHSNGHSSPARVAPSGKTTPLNTEKKPQINGHPSPLHLPASINNNHADVEGYMKTDDRMRLAKERREERERSLAAREQLIREKERRARLQYERTVEERWRRLEEQRQKEELRRAAVEEKRRQQLEEEKERLEALMKRSLERSLQLEQRTKRWTRGCPTAAGDSENVPLPFSAASAFSHGITSPLPAASESAPCSPHRSPYRGTLNPVDHNRGLLGGSQSTPNTPKKERLRRNRRTASPAFVSPVRRAESPVIVNKHLASPTTPKLTSKMRSQSPSAVRHHHSSPMRHCPNLSTDDLKVEDKRAEGHAEESKAETSAKKKSNVKSSDSSSQAEKPVEKNAVNVEACKDKSSKAETFDKGETLEKTDSSDKNDPADNTSAKVDASEKKPLKSNNNNQDADKRKESSPRTPTGKLAAGTTNAEEASRLLAERRRQAREQKELEEKKREREEEERLKAEQLKKQLAQEQPRQEKEIHPVKEEKKKQEDLHKQKEEDEKRQMEEQEKELETQMDREKEKAKVQAEEDAERQRQDRELQKIQEEEERQLRKKRIEEIMKRTRKGDADLKEGQAETQSVSPGEVKMNVQTSDQANEQAIQKVAFQVIEQVKVQSCKREDSPVKKEPAAQPDNQKSVQVKKPTDQVASPKSVPEKGPHAKQVGEHQGTQVNKNGTSHLLKRQERPPETQANKQDGERSNGKAADQITKELTKKAETKAKESAVTNGEIKGQGSVGSHLTCEVSKQQGLQVEVTRSVSTPDGKVKGGKVDVTRPSVKPLLVGHPSPPIIRLESLDVKGTGSCDEVQLMEVSPVSKEELISIPEFSPVNEVQLNSMSNTRALEDLLDLTGHVAYPKLSSEGNVGDCNKNLIQGVVSPMADSKLLQLSPQSSNKLSIQ
ncbi:MAP7 domain-containing protein 2a [Polymixia lowei]